MFISIEKFGRDHWSTFAYIETRIVDYMGVLDKRHMRCDIDRHPFFAHEGSKGEKHPTRLLGGELAESHDDWDCIDDLVEAGLLEWNGTGVNPIFQLTEKGQSIAATLRTYKVKGGQFAAFQV